jgi:hypothetical protein
MLHFFLTGYAIRENSYNRYEFYNFELAKWAEYYLGQKTSFHQSNWCTGKVTENPHDILLGHPTWDNPDLAAASGLGQIKCDWVKDNALSPHEPCHPNTYIIMPWVPEFPQEWSPNLVKVNSQLLAAKKIFALCGQTWIDRTFAKTDDSIQAQVKQKLIRTNIGIALQNFPFVKQTFNPIGKRQMLHVSTLGSYKGFDVTCESIKGLDTLLNVASLSLKADRGMVNVRIGDRPYSFNFLGGIDNGDPQTNQWIVDTCDFYIHTATQDAQATAILENCARGLIPLITPESGFDCPDAIFLTHDPVENRRMIEWALNLPEAELLARSQKIRNYLAKAHNWKTIFDSIWDEIQLDIKKDTKSSIGNIGIPPAHLQKNTESEIGDGLLEFQRDINLITFPNWQAGLDSVREALQPAIANLLKHPQRGAIALFIDVCDIATEVADAFLADFLLETIMQEDYDLEEEPKISLIYDLSEVEWRSLKSKLNGSIQICSENLVRTHQICSCDIAVIPADSILLKEF